MLRLFIFLALLVLMLNTACTRQDDAGDATIFYGSWSMGTRYGDTLYFSQKEGHNILQYNQSHNPGFLAYKEIRYTYTNSKLSIAMFGPSQTLEELSSFRWVQYGKTFEVYESELYPFVATMAMYVRFTKIN